MKNDGFAEPPKMTPFEGKFSEHDVRALAHFVKNRLGWERPALAAERPLLLRARRREARQAAFLGPLVLGGSAQYVSSALLAATWPDDI